MILSLIKHKDLTSEELVVDYNCFAQINYLKGKELIFKDIFKLGITLKSVLKEIINCNNIKALLPLYILVKRKVKELVEVLFKTKKGHERGISILNIRLITSKKFKKL